jgi:hypothetical protein
MVLTFDNHSCIPSADRLPVDYVPSSTAIKSSAWFPRAVDDGLIWQVPRSSPGCLRRVGVQESRIFLH